MKFKVKSNLVEKLNDREKQVYIDIIEAAEDIEELEDIVHEIFFYDKSLFVKLRHFPKDKSFEELKANKLKVLKDSLNESLNESIDPNSIDRFIQDNYEVLKRLGEK